MKWWKTTTNVLRHWSRVLSWAGTHFIHGVTVLPYFNLSDSSAGHTRCVFGCYWSVCHSTGRDPRTGNRHTRLHRYVLWDEEIFSTFIFAAIILDECHLPPSFGAGHMIRAGGSSAPLLAHTVAAIAVTEQAAIWRGWRGHDISLYLYNTTACHRRPLALIMSPAAESYDRTSNNNNNNNNQNDHNNNDDDDDKRYGTRYTVIKNKEIQFTSGWSLTGTNTFSVMVTGAPSGSGSTSGSFFTPFTSNRLARTLVISVTTNRSI